MIQLESLDAELILKSLLFSLHLAMSVPHIARNSVSGMLRLVLMTLAAIGKDRIIIKCFNVFEEAHQQSSAAQICISLILGVSHSDNLHYSLHQIWHCPFCYRTSDYMSW